MPIVPISLDEVQYARKHLQQYDDALASDELTKILDWLSKKEDELDQKNKRFLTKDKFQLCFDECAICGQDYDDYTEWHLVEPMNKEVFTFRVCNDCTEFTGRFYKFLQERLEIKEAVA